MVQERLRAARDVIKGVKLPELPSEVLLLDQELKSKFANTAQVASIIEKNTVMAGEVLRAINSPVMKLEMPVKSVRDAVNLLGLENIYNLVVASALKQLFGDNALYKDVMDFSVDVAFCMADISEWVDDITRDEAYMMGLFHNVGALVLVTKDIENYGKVYSNSLSKPFSATLFEYKNYGTDHQMVGVLVAKKWGLPLDYMNAIMLHHTPEVSAIEQNRVRALVAMIQLASAMVAEISLGSYISSEVKQMAKNAQEDLMIPEEILSEIRTAFMSYTFK